MSNLISLTNGLGSALGVGHLGQSMDHYYDLVGRQHSQGLANILFQDEQNKIKNIDKILNDEKLLLLIEE